MAEPSLNQTSAGATPPLMTYQLECVVDQSEEMTEWIGSLRPVFSRALLYVVLGFIAIAVLWMWQGKVDVVATASFRLVPLGQVNIIQAPRNGQIETMGVSEGDRVYPGQVLVKLQSSETRSELQTIEQAKVAFQKAEYDLLEAWPQKKKLVQQNAKALEEKIVLIQTLMSAHREVLVSYQQENDSPSGMSSDLNMQSGLRQAVVGHLKMHCDRQQKMFAHGFISRADLEQAQMQYLHALAEYPSQLAEIYTQEQVVQDLKRQVLEICIEMNREEAHMQNVFQQAQLQLTQARQNADRQMDGDADLIVAKTSGVITQVFVNSDGQWVGKGQEWMTMAPDAVPMVAEVTFLNKDIGLIASGQRVKLKYDAFPFQDFGIQHGRLLHISPDVIMDERLGPVFRGRVALDEFVVVVKEVTVPLRYGMMGVAEVVTDRQSILIRLLSPLRKLQKTVEFSEVKEGDTRVGTGG